MKIILLENPFDKEKLIQTYQKQIIFKLKIIRIKVRIKMDLDFENESLFDELGPEKIIFLRKPEFNMKGILVIDNSSFGIPAGGVRFAENITIEEMARLARAMTLKFCTFGLSCGGAKSGLIGNPLDENRDLLITSFADALAPFIKTNAYYPGPDMGTYDSDLERIFKTVGRPELTPRKVGLMKNGVPVEELFTGYGVLYCLETVLKSLKFGDNYKPKIILEGFGKVGTALAIGLKESGYLLTGVSTITSAIYDDDGLDIDELLKLKAEFGGDDLINHYESKNLIRIPKEKLFELSSEYSTEILIPGARQDAINEGNVDKISAKAIVSAANIPYAKGIVEILEEKGIIAFPDYVSNAGEVLAISVINNPTSVDQIFNHVKTKITEKSMEILKGAKENNISTYEFAKREAINAYKKQAIKKRKRIERYSKKY
jgi:glutamate dehydrogenase (NAD(P)+)